MMDCTEQEKVFKVLWIEFSKEIGEITILSIDIRIDKSSSIVTDGTASPYNPVMLFKKFFMVFFR